MSIWSVDCTWIGDRILKPHIFAKLATCCSQSMHIGLIECSHNFTKYEPKNLHSFYIVLYQLS
jgi:hypothetical protein